MADSRLVNSDSVLILGKDTGEGLELLKRIQIHLDTSEFYTYIIKEKPNIIGESVSESLALWPFIHKIPLKFKYIG